MRNIRTILATTAILMLPALIFAQAQTTFKLKKPLTEADKSILIKVAEKSFYPDGNFNFTIVSQDLRPKAYDGEPSKRTMPEDTIALLKKLKKTDDDAMVYRELGDVCIKLARRQQADYYLQKALNIYNAKMEKNPKDWEIVSEKGDVYSAMDNTDFCLLEYNMALYNNPKDSTARAMIPMTYIRVGKYDDAYKKIKDNIKAEPQNITHYIWLPLVSFYETMGKTKLPSGVTEAEYYKNKKVDDIIDLSILKNAAETYKDDYSFTLFYKVARHMSLVFKSYFTFSKEERRFNCDEADLNELAELEKFYNDGLNKKDFPNKYIFYKALGMISLMKNENDKAIPLFREAIKYKPVNKSTFSNNSSEVYDNMIATYMLKRDTVKSIAMIKEKIETKPAVNPVASDYALLARFQMCKQQYTDVENTCREIININLYNADAYLGLCALSLRNNNLQAAEEYVNYAYRCNPNNSDVFVMFGVISMLKDKPNEAFYSFQSAIDAGGWDKDVSKIMDDYFEVKN